MEYPKKNTLVKATKVTLLTQSKIRIGEVSTGKLLSDLKTGGQLELKEKNGFFKTSTIQSITKTQEDDFIVQTATSVYFVQEF